MARDYITYVEIYEIIRGIKNKHKLLTAEEVTEIIHTNIESGFVINGHTIKAAFQKYFNPFLDRETYWYHFLCPKCERRCKKLYIVNDKSSLCRKCAKIKQATRINGNADRVLRIQEYINKIYTNRSLSNRQKNRIINNIIRT